MNYKELIEKSEKCLQKAREYLLAGEKDLATFYYNVSSGYKNKARALPVGQA